MNKVIDPIYLHNLHWEHEKTFKELASIFKCSTGTIHNIFKSNNLLARKRGHIKGKYKMSLSNREKLSKIHKGKIISVETREKMAEAKRLKTFTGHRKYRSDGYIHIYVPTHPQASKEGYVMEHRLVMERKLGRKLLPSEVVHHKNRIRSDNRIENLQLFSNSSEHQRYHALYTRKYNNRGFSS